MRHFRIRLSLSLVLWLGGLGLAWSLAGNKPVVLASSFASISGPLKVQDPPPVKVFQLRPGQGHPRNIVPRVIHSYPFSLRPGDFLHLVFYQQDVDIVADVIDPLKHEILEVDTLNGAHGPEDVPFVAEAAGVYEVRISATLAGQYSSRIVAHRPATPRDRILASSVRAYFNGEVARRLGRLAQEIEKDYTEAARLAGEVGESAHRADAYYQLEKRQCAEGRWKDCRDSCLRSLALYEDVGNIPQQSIVLSDMGYAFNKLGESKRAYEIFLRSIELARKAHRPKSEATASLSLGLLQLDLGQIEPALQNLERSRDLSRQGGNSSGEALALNGIGRLYTFLGEVDRALDFHRQAIERLDGGSDAAMAETLVHIGDAYRKANRLVLSISYYLRGLYIFRKANDLDRQATTLNNLGLAYYFGQQYREARGAFLQALRIFHEREELADESICWSNVGWVQLSLDDIPQAVKAFESSLLVSQRINRRPAESASYFGLAWAERRRNNLIGAQKNAQRAIDVLESLRSEAMKPDIRSSLLGSRFNFYELLVDVLMEQHRLQPAAGHDIEAFNASEGARARSLLESLGQRSPPPLLSMSEIQQGVLDKETILLEYHLGDERSFLWAVTTDSYASFELPGRSAIEPLVRDVYGLLKKSDQKEVVGEALRKTRTLARILLGPVASHLGNKRLLIVTPPALQYVPFAAFPDLSTVEQERSELPWPVPLAWKHEIINSPSASVTLALRATRTGRLANRRLLAVVADPVYEHSDKRLRNAPPLQGSELLGGGRFKRLKHSHEEADAIVSIVGRQDVLELRDFDANRKRVLDGDLRFFKYLHFSAHGDPHAEQPDLSSIVLSSLDAQGQPHDPFLRAQDIRTLRLTADLVVLSSCGSGLGQEVQGEGLVGLTQAFFTAGASGVLVSLWDVDDLATSEIMPLFYSKLLKKGLKPSEALRQAQRFMWSQPRRNAPVYWAGFVEQGDWK